ncbi:TetR/AcrR family transcriptional regulator [Nannocystis punicea]|uniref:TetR/AcrR family transcriptional regulator n=1 Tax=Nannocystis punicea TaxID=2995304 RepID=A0ABY7GSS6_9BACT|nr:TetR/AcrR family transcriptional regulator [Nannocystis poenicansa]WAS90011.1 TetR/AcrR family transcriptional regulator [Nannocystis poenicansa]
MEFNSTIIGKKFHSIRDLVKRGRLGYDRAAMAVTRQTGAARREALLDAALRCFEQHGLMRTGIEDIRKAAGASPSSVYHLFKDLPALVAALLARTFQRLHDSVGPRVLTTRTPRTAVRTLVEAHVDWVLGHEAEARFMYQALALELDGEHRAALRAHKAALKADLTAHFTGLGVFPRARAPEVMLDVVLLGPVHQACRLYLSSPGSVDPRWMRTALPDLAWRSVR